MPSPEELAHADRNSSTLAADDIIVLEFEADSVAAGTARDVVFVTTGAWTGETSSSSRQAGHRNVLAVPELELVGPQPRRGPITMRLRLPGPSDARIQVFDVQGRLVRTLIDERLRAGDHVVSWDLKDERAHRVGEGIYFTRLRAGKTSEVRKLVVLE